MDGTPTGTPFWRHLRKTLTDRHLSMAELGRLSGVKPQAIYKWKLTQPSVASVRKIAKVLSDDPRHLLVLAGHLDASDLEPPLAGPHETPSATTMTDTGCDIETVIMASSRLTPEQKTALLQTIHVFLHMNIQQPTRRDYHHR